MLYLAGIFIAFFLGALLLTKKGKSTADKVLAAWLVVIGFHLLLYYLYISKGIYGYPWLLGIGMPLPLLHGPFLYLYVASLTGRVPQIRIQELLHFLPATISLLAITPFILEPAEEKIRVFEHRGAGHEVYLFFNSIAIIASGIVYVVLALVLLRRHRRSILNEFSSTDKINLRWLQYLIYSIAVIWVFVILSIDTLVFGSAVVLVMIIGYFGIKQVGIFTHRPVIADSLPGSIAAAPEIEPETPVMETEAPKKYRKSGLSEEAAVELHKKLSGLIADEKPFREPELTLDDLAGRLNTQTNYLSQIINDREGKNFYDYINTLRIEEFKKIVGIPGNDKFTLLGLAFDCGFNSKSSFNKYFRRVTGVSPTEYISGQKR